MTYIWILDCSNACVTKVKLSEEREQELETFLDNDGDMESYLHDHEDEFGVSLSNSSWMVTKNDEVYEVDF